MQLEEHFYDILLVSASEKFNQSLLPLLPESRFSVKVLGDIASARRSILQKRPDIVIINAPLPDDFGTRFALDVCENSSTGVLLIIKSEHYSEITAKVSPYGVLTLSKPTTSGMIIQSLQLLCSMRERLRRMEQKTLSVEEEMQEIRIINRAKWILIDELKMTEAQAHRYIEKQAMDRCLTKKTVAENIILTYK